MEEKRLLLRLAIIALPTIFLLAYCTGVKLLEPSREESYPIWLPVTGKIAPDGNIPEEDQLRTQLNLSIDQTICHTYYAEDDFVSFKNAVGQQTVTVFLVYDLVGNWANNQVTAIYQYTMEGEKSYACTSVTSVSAGGTPKSYKLQGGRVTIHFSFDGVGIVGVTGIVLPQVIYVFLMFILAIVWLVATLELADNTKKMGSFR